MTWRSLGCFALRSTQLFARVTPSRSSSCLRRTSSGSHLSARCEGPTSSERGVWGSRNEGGFDFEFGEGDWIDEGDGHVVCDVHQMYRLKGVEEPAYERDRRIELTIRAGQVARYEVRIVG